MSIGIGAIAHLILCDDKTVAYQYGSYNLNKKNLETQNVFVMVVFQLKEVVS